MVAGISLSMLLWLAAGLSAAGSCVSAELTICPLLCCRGTALGESAQSQPQSQPLTKMHLSHPKLPALGTPIRQPG